MCVHVREETGSSEEGTSVRCSVALGASFFFTKLPLVPVTGSKAVCLAHSMNTRVTSVTGREWANMLPWFKKSSLCQVESPRLKQ